jgi:ubiquinone/menaquinone biosynthesis C-methylase UbiE
MNEYADHQEYNKKIFAKLALYYDPLISPLRRLRRKVVTLSEAHEGTRVLDLACGTGEQSIPFARAGCDVTGMDLSEEMLSKAQKKVKPGMRIKFLRGDASQLPFDDASFDIATISFGLHDMPRHMAMRILSEMKRVTKPNGKMIIVEHHKSHNPFGRLMHWIFLHIDTRYYPSFVEEGLESYLKKSVLSPLHHSIHFGGIVQVAVCGKSP